MHMHYLGFKYKVVQWQGPRDYTRKYTDSGFKNISKLET